MLSHLTTRVPSRPIHQLGHHYPAAWWRHRGGQQDRKLRRVYDTTSAQRMRNYAKDRFPPESAGLLHFEAREPRRVSIASWLCFADIPERQHVRAQYARYVATP